MLFAPFESWIVDFLSSCWIIEQSYHRANTPSIYRTIRVVVLMGPSIRLWEGQTNTCTIKNTHKCTHTHTLSQTQMHTAVTQGSSKELVVFQQWCEHVRKCAYTMATHAGSTVLQSVAVLQCHRRTPIKHTIIYRGPVATCNRALKTAFLGYPLLVYAFLFIFLCHKTPPPLPRRRGF